IQALADRVSSVFVPVVLLVAVITFVAWLVWGPAPSLAYALTNAVAVLIIACPCALGLATPMSIMVSVGRGAQLGVLIRDAAALQRAEAVTHVVTDKTGTLTEGRPELARMHPKEDLEENQVLAWAAALEQGSEHPLAHAIVKAAYARQLTLPRVEGFHSTTGAGVSGTIDGRPMRIGKRSWLVNEGVAISAKWDQKAEELLG